MTLMALVWLVSVLSSIKVFLDSYLTVILLFVLVVYLIGKIHVSLYSKLNIWWGGKGWDDIGDGTTIALKKPLLNVDGKTSLGIGSYRIDKYTEFCYLVATDGTRYGRVPKNVVLEAMEGSISDTENGASHFADVPAMSPLNKSKTVAIALITLSILLPSDTTMKYMAGAYLVETVYTSQFGKEVTALSRKAITTQLESWSKDTPDLVPLVEQLHKEVRDVQSEK